jgi:hypothetical protein
VALFRKATEQEEQRLRKTAQEKISPGLEAGTLAQEGLAYVDLPEIKSIS